MSAAEPIEPIEPIEALVTDRFEHATRHNTGAQSIHVLGVVASYSGTTPGNDVRARLRGLLGAYP
jgi:hypothetical protein